jgi:ParB-like chromosome segregation protein Spo0J
MSLFDVREGRKAANAVARASHGTSYVRNDLLLTLQVQSYSMESLRSPTRRVRKSDVAHIREIASSIRAFGFNVPLVVGRNNIVLDGESCLGATRQLGLETVSCIRVDHLNATEQRLLRWL